MRVIVLLLGEFTAAFTVTEIRRAVMLTETNCSFIIYSVQHFAFKVFYYF